MKGVARTRQGGFTLIEIMAVVLLLGLVMSGVSFGLNRFVPGQQMDSECRQLLSQLDLARSSAIAAGRPYRVVIDIDDHTYWTYTPYDIEGRIAKTKDDQTHLGRMVLEKGVDFAGVLEAGKDGPTTEGKVELNFGALGVNHDVVIYLSNPMSEKYDKTVFMGGLTGRNSISDGHVLPGTVRDEDFDQ